MKKSLISLFALGVPALAGYAAAQSINVTGTLNDPVTSVPFSVTVQQSGTGTLFPQMGSQASSVYPWATYPPGVTYNGGIPERPQCGATLTPRGGGQSDYTNLTNAIHACSDGQMLKLAAGVFVLNNNEIINIGYNPTQNNITIRGAGPGPGNAVPNNSSVVPNVSVCGATPCTIIYNKGWSTASGPIFAVNPNSSGNGWLDTPINLSVDAVQGSRTITLASAPTAGIFAGRLVRIDMLTGDTNNPPSYVYAASPAAPDLWFGGLGSCGAPQSGCQGWYGRDYRELGQVVKVTAVSGNTLTIESPLSMTYPRAAQAQVIGYRTGVTQSRGIGLEEMYLYGGGNAAGNIGIELCDSCWVRHVESHWADGASIALATCYRCEIRDSYIHESHNNGPNFMPFGQPTNGGSSYLMSIDRDNANSLVENNILWLGDKPMVMRGSGGGNVIAYNYTDDTLEVGEPNGAEAGINAGHYGVPHFELFEGNQSHRYTGDSLWGNSIYITVFRNRLMGVRTSGNGPGSGYRSDGTALSTWVNGAGYPFCDCWSRSAVQMQAMSFWHSLVGNVLGYNGMTLIIGQPWIPYGSSFTSTQNTWAYEWLNTTQNPDNVVAMYVIGNQISDAGPPNFPGDANLYRKTNRQGNYDYVTRSQIWYASYGGSGTTSTGSPQALPNSLYLSAKPAFFGPNVWPWVDPSTGTTYTLPAKQRFDMGAPNACLNMVSGVCHD